MMLTLAKIPRTPLTGFHVIFDKILVDFWHFLFLTVAGNPVVDIGVPAYLLNSSLHSHWMSSETNFIGFSTEKFIGASRVAFCWIFG